MRKRDWWEILPSGPDDREANKGPTRVLDSLDDVVQSLAQAESEDAGESLYDEPTEYGDSEEGDGSECNGVVWVA